MSRRPGSVDPPRPVEPEVHLAGTVPSSVVAAAVRTGRWQRVRHGAYVPALPDEDAWAHRRRLAHARIAAVAHALDAEQVLSHTSAALLWGLPVVDAGTVVHLVQAVNPRSGGAADVRRHRHRLEPEDVVELDGRRVTSLERTVLDCATSLPTRWALVLGDAALRRGADRDICLERLGSWRGRRGVARAREVLRYADDGAESPGESLLRHDLLAVGLPVPTTQVPVVTAEGTVWADLGWEEWRLLLEYDGVAKYTARSTAADAVLRERRREVAVEAVGSRMLRATSTDLGDRAALLRTVLRWAPPGTADTLVARPWLATT